MWPRQEERDCQNLKDGLGLLVEVTMDSKGLHGVFMGTVSMGTVSISMNKHGHPRQLQWTSIQNEQILVTAGIE